MRSQIARFLLDGYTPIRYLPPTRRATLVIIHEERSLQLRNQLRDSLQLIEHKIHAPLFMDAPKNAWAIQLISLFW